MEETEIKAAADRLKTEVTATAEKAGKDAAELAVKEVKALADEAKAAAATNATAQEATQKHLDALDIRLKHGYNGDPSKDGGMGTIRKALEDNAALLKAFAETGHGRKEISITDIKATITSGNVTAAGLAGVIAPLRLPGIITQPDRPQHVRDFIATGQTTSNQVVYVRESAYTDLTGVTAEGALKPNSQLNLETKVAPVVKIANYFKISEEMLTDIPQLLSYISGRATSKLLLVEDAQLMNGSGVGLNINGIKTQATAFTGGSIKVTTPNDFDVLRAAISQIRLKEYQANAIMLNPEDAAIMEMTKNTQGSYVLPAMLGGTPNAISGVRVIENTIMAPGTFLVGDFALGAQVFFREGISIRVYDQNEDDAIKNLCTVVIEERLALCVYRPEVFVTGTFAAAITAITKV